MKDLSSLGCSVPKMGFVVWVILSVQLLRSGNSLVFSKFRRTDIFNEILDNGLINSEVDTSLPTCARKCSRDMNCRRFKYCNDDVTSGQCLTYEDGQNCPHNGNGQQCHCFMKVINFEDGVYNCPIGYYGNSCENVIKHCSEGRLHGLKDLGKKLAFIQPEGAEEPFEVFCYFSYAGLTYIQFRDNRASPVNFNRTLEDYINGFGHPRYNHWLGLKRISLISKSTATRCNIEITDPNYCQVYYDICHISGPEDDYKITLSSYNPSGNYGDQCGDSLQVVDNVNEAPFSAYDVDFSNNGCAARMAGGWWYAQTATCTQGNLNAPLVSAGEVASDPSIMRMKWVFDRNDNVIKVSSIRLMRLDVP